MVDVTTETEIARPIDEVAAYVADPANAPRWYDNIKSVDWKTEPPAAVGSRVASSSFNASSRSRRHRCACRA